MTHVADLLDWVAPTRPYKIVYLLVALVGLVACFVPLFDLLGYESAALLGVCVGLVAPFLTLHAIRGGLLPGPLGDRATRSPARDFFLLFARHLPLLAVPALLLILNALRVRNCDMLLGAAFWLVIPVVSLLVGQAVGWVAAALFPDRTKLQTGSVVLVILASAVAFGLHLALEPPITGHQLFLGYFSGSIYDEALSFPESLGWYRLMNVVGICAILASIEVVWLRRNQRPIRWVLLTGLVFATAFGGLFVHRKELGVDRDREYILEQLDGRRETEHFVIHYAKNERFVDEIDMVAQDHEYRYAEMQELFETDPASDGKIHSFVYPSRAAKGELMGARRTLVAKIWLGEMHIIWRGFGDHLLAHELSHLFTAPFGAGPLDLSTQFGIGVNMGLVEGIATAADWPINDLDPHEASAALRRMEKAPDISNIVGASGFWTQSSGRAYILMGSFVRYLLDEYGIDKFKKVYGYGDFEAAYGKTPDALVDEWEAYLSEIELSDEKLALAKYLYDRPSIFQKACARTIAELRRKANRASAAGNVGRARELFERILGHTPGAMRYRIEYAEALSKAKAFDEALTKVEEMLEEELPPVQRARLKHLKGDLHWRLDERAEAGRAFRECLDEGLPSNMRRLIRVKYETVDRSPRSIRELAFTYLLGQKSSSISLYFPMEWYRRRPEDPLAAYLVGRRLWSAHEWEAARPYLVQARRGLPDGILADETALMLGQVEYFLGDLSGAQSAFDALQENRRTRYRMYSHEWRSRIAWKRRNR